MVSNVLTVSRDGRVEAPVFEQRFNGYERGQVDAWVRSMMDREVRVLAEYGQTRVQLDAAVRELDSLRGKVSGLEARCVKAEQAEAEARRRAENPIAAVGDAAQSYFNDVKAKADRVLEDAHRQADDVLRKAKADADGMRVKARHTVDDAQSRAEGIVKAAEGKAAAVEKALAERSRVADDHVADARRMVVEYRRLLTEAAEGLQADRVTDPAVKPSVAKPAAVAGVDVKPVAKPAPRPARPARTGGTRG